MYLKINENINSLRSFIQNKNEIVFIFNDNIQEDYFSDVNNVELYSDDNMFLATYDLSNFNIQFTENGMYLKDKNFVEDINLKKVEKIELSKVLLAEWLENNPMLFTDGKYYSVTAEKQSLLNSNLASYERATQAGIEYPLKWNSTGDECVEWEYTDLLKLSLTIAGYVSPKIAKQQQIEIQINNCTSVEEIENVLIDYNSTEESEEDIVDYNVSDESISE